MIIRDATMDDLDDMVRMATAFYATTTYAEFAPINPDTLEVLAQFIIDDGVLLVAEVEGDVVGMVGVIVTSFMFNTDYKSAHEVMWWVDPTARSFGVGLPLLRAVEPACKARGAGIIQMMRLSTSPPEVDVMYRRAGYAPSETSFTKVI